VNQFNPRLIEMEITVFMFLPVSDLDVPNRRNEPQKMPMCGSQSTPMY